MRISGRHAQPRRQRFAIQGRRAFQTAIEAGVPVVPVAIQGSGAVLPPSGFGVRPGTITLRIGDPLSTKGLQSHDRQALAQRAHDAVVALLLH